MQNSPTPAGTSSETSTEALPTLELHDLAPDPTEEWQRMLRFSGPTEAERAAMATSVETLFRRGPELAVNTYDYLRSVPETAAILGWETEIDPAHLEERRRFFTIWLARTLGMDTGEEFALYLFKAGKYHAGHGPRRIHTPPPYITASIGLVLAAFSRYMAEAQLPAEIIAGAMAGWSKYLTLQLNQMELGYKIALDLDRGMFPIRVTVFSRLRTLLDIQEVTIRAYEGASLADLLTKFFNYFPQARSEAFERVWRSEEKSSSFWTEVVPAYIPRQGWRVLFNGRDVTYAGGFSTPLHTGDEVSIFPPGR